MDKPYKDALAFVDCLSQEIEGYLQVHRLDALVYPSGKSFGIPAVRLAAPGGLPIVSYPSPYKTGHHIR